LSIVAFGLACFDILAMGWILFIAYVETPLRNMSIININPMDVVEPLWDDIGDMLDDNDALLVEFDNPDDSYLLALPSLLFETLEF